MSREEKIGFHKGAINTLLKERQELLKMVSIVSKLLEMHVSALKEMGVDLTKQIKKVDREKQKSEHESKSEDDDFENFY